MSQSPGVSPANERLSQDLLPDEWLGGEFTNAVLSQAVRARSAVVVSVQDTRCSAAGRQLLKEALDGFDGTLILPDYLEQRPEPLSLSRFCNEVSDRTLGGALVRLRDGPGVEIATTMADEPLTICAELPERWLPPSGLGNAAAATHLALTERREFTGFSHLSLCCGNAELALRYAPLLRAAGIRSVFLPDSERQRNDIDLMAELREAGCEIVTSPTQLRQLLSEQGALLADQFQLEIPVLLFEDRGIVPDDHVRLVAAHVFLGQLQLCLERLPHLLADSWLQRIEIEGDQGNQIYNTVLARMFRLDHTIAAIKRSANSASKYIDRNAPGLGLSESADLDEPDRTIEELRKFEGYLAGRYHFAGMAGTAELAHLAWQLRTLAEQCGADLFQPAHFDPVAEQTCFHHAPTENLCAELAHHTSAFRARPRSPRVYSDGITVTAHPKERFMEDIKKGARIITYEENGALRGYALYFPPTCTARVMPEVLQWTREPATAYVHFILIDRQASDRAYRFLDRALELHLVADGAEVAAGYVFERNRPGLIVHRAIGGWELTSYTHTVKSDFPPDPREVSRTGRGPQEGTEARFIGITKHLPNPSWESVDYVRADRSTCMDEAERIMAGEGLLGLGGGHWEGFVAAFDTLRNRQEWLKQQEHLWRLLDLCKEGDISPQALARHIRRYDVVPIPLARSVDVRISRILSAEGAADSKKALEIEREVSPYLIPRVRVARELAAADKVMATYIRHIDMEFRSRGKDVWLELMRESPLAVKTAFIEKMMAEGNGQAAE